MIATALPTFGWLNGTFGPDRRASHEASMRVGDGERRKQTCTAH